MTLLEAIRVSKRYGDFTALSDVSVAINEGEYVSIIGPNGAGKTTLVNLLSGAARPSKGRVSFKGHDVAAKGPVRLVRLGMARSFQLVNIFPRLSVAETIAVAAVSRLGLGFRLFGSLWGSKRLRDTVHEVAQLFGLSNKLDGPAGALSQGDKKLLDVASAFTLKPEVILLDEPTSGVSTAEKSILMQVMVEAARRVGIRAIIQVEHDMDIVFNYSNRIIAVHTGRVIADGTPDAVRADDEVMAAIVGRHRVHAKH